MTDEIAESLVKRVEELQNSPKCKDRRKKKQRNWKNGYAQAVYEYFEQIEKLLSAGDTIYSLFEFFRDSEIFTRDADYRFFDRAFVREKRRRTEAQVKKSQSPRSTSFATTSDNNDEDNRNSIKPRRDRKEF